MQSNHVFSSRRGRIALIFGSLTALLLVFATLGRSSSNLASRLRTFSNHDRLLSPSPSQSQDVVTDSDGVPVQWSDFAYVQYVTNANYLCNSLMIFEALRRHETKAELLMMYPHQWEMAADGNYESKLLIQAQNMYNVQMKPIQVRTYTNVGDPTWQDSYTKLLAFNQTQYKRVISLDSDATVLNRMDELFLLPSAPVAMPRAYWASSTFLSSQLIVIEPSQQEYQRIEEAMEHHKGNEYDMDILNRLYENSSTVIPHRTYDLLSGEFRGKNHANYLGSPDEVWDATKVLAEAKFVHFSDWPMPKPWLNAPDYEWERHQPKCKEVPDKKPDCSDRDIWIELRKDFSARRERICGHAFDKRAVRFDKRNGMRPRNEPVFI